MPRLPSLVAGLTIVAVGVLALLDGEGTLTVDGGVLLAVLLLGLGAAGVSRGVGAGD